MYKINIFVFFILNIISNQFLSGFGVLGASKRVQKQVISFGKTDYESISSANIASKPQFGAQTSRQDRFKTLLWKPNQLPRLRQESILKPNIFLCEHSFASSINTRTSDHLRLARRLMLPLTLSPSPPEPKTWF